MTLPRISIIIGTTRQNRFGDRPAHWLHKLAAARGDAEYEVLDLRDYPMAMFDDPAAPARVPSTDKEAQRFAAKLARADGIIFITAEYNHSVPGVLKNAIDHVYAEFNRKPAGFVGYGNAGGARAIEQLRLILIELKMAPLQPAVQLGVTELRALKSGEKDFADFEHLAHSAGVMLDDLLWWTHALKAARTPERETVAS